MNNASSNAPGHPGFDALWTASTKSAVGTALGSISRAWFTIGDGILNEIYYPRIDQAAVRDCGFIVTDGEAFFSEEKAATDSRVEWIEEGVPAFRVTNTCKAGRFVITKEIIADPVRHAVLQRVVFEPKQGSLEDYHLHVLIAPHLADSGDGNTAEIGDFKGVPTLQACKDDCALAMICSAPWLGRSAGYVGASDGWQDLSQHRRMTWFYDSAADGNVALTGEIDLKACGGEFVLALGFGRSVTDAGHRARAALQAGYDSARATYIQQWRDWQASCREPDGEESWRAWRRGTAVIRTHLSKDFQGSIVASLSIPWGSTRGDDSRAGYHVCWPRDGFEAAGALLAAGAFEEARQCLGYLRVTQEADGHWPQNMWLNGCVHWDGIQLDEVAAPVLLLDLARRQGALDDAALRELWPMARAATCYLLQSGPSTRQDRWEENPGFTAFTLATEITALLIAAALAEQHEECELASRLRTTADAWNANIERWTYVEGTGLARRFGVDGYYVRTAPQVADDEHPLPGQRVRLANQSQEADYSAAELVSPDTLALVRFGLRDAHDPRIVNTIKVIDGLLKVETPTGPCWHRYNHDGYGEHSDGAPFNDSGIGRAWPLLTGERAHYELLAGRPEEARRLCRAMESFACDSGLLPEQIWDTDDIPGLGLFFGRPSHSARPLVWAHAEHIKLLRSLRDGAVFDLPPASYERYVRRR